MSKSILVSGVSSIVGLGTVKNLRQYRESSKEDLIIIGSSIYSDNIARYLCDFYEIAPFSNDINYFNWLGSVIKKYNIDLLIPCIELDVLIWSKNRSFFSCFNSVPLLNNSLLIDLCSDKWNFYNFFKSSKYAIPSKKDEDFYSIVNDFGLPFIVKPCNGSGSKGVCIINTYDEFIAYKNKFSNSISQPIIGSSQEEFTVSAFFDNESFLFDYCCLRRKLSKYGFTEIAETTNIDGIDLVLIELGRLFSAVGPTNFQFRIDSCNKLKLLEINPRISSATSIRANFGYNEQKISVEYFLNKKLIKDIKKTGKVYRYFEDFVIYN